MTSQERVEFVHGLLSMFTIIVQEGEYDPAFLELMATDEKFIMITRYQLQLINKYKPTNHLHHEQESV